MTKKRRTKPPHEPTAETRAQVEALSGYGIRQDEIAQYLNIDPKTLRKHYADQLAGGMTKANVAVARSLHKQATDGGNVAAAIFWMKARAGWREKHEVELSGPGGGAIPVIAGTMTPAEAAAAYAATLDDRGG